MNLHDYTMPLLSGDMQSLGDYKDNIVLIVNTASKCGFTHQYKGLENLYQKYKNDGLVILGFPCNQFGHQEPDDAPEIEKFCETNYGITFPLFDKVNVKGSNAVQLFKDLQEEAPGILGSKAIKWNFTKFLINPATKKVSRYSPKTKPENIDADIKTVLDKIVDRVE